MAATKSPGVLPVGDGRRPRQRDRAPADPGAEGEGTEYLGYSKAQSENCNLAPRTRSLQECVAESKTDDATGHKPPVEQDDRVRIPTSVEVTPRFESAFDRQGKPSARTVPARMLPMVTTTAATPDQGSSS